MTRRKCTKPVATAAQVDYSSIHPPFSRVLRIPDDSDEQDATASDVNMRYNAGTYAGTQFILVKAIARPLRFGTVHKGRPCLERERGGIKQCYDSGDSTLRYTS
jgi:hypothetical protein